MMINRGVFRKPFWFSVHFIAIIAFVLLYLPLVTLVLGSFWVRGPEGLTWTTEWYGKLFQNEAILDSLSLSIFIATVSMVISSVIGTGAALALVRTKFPFRKGMDLLTHVPLIMPEIVMGLSLLIWFVFLRITLGSFSIILAHVTFSVSYVILTVKSRLQGFDQSLEEAARDLGATPLQVFFKVTLPLIWPGVLSGALMAFTLSFDDFLITFFTAGVGSETLPVRIYTMVRFGVSPELNALSTLMIATTLFVVFFFFRPSDQQAIRGI